MLVACGVPLPEPRATFACGKSLSLTDTSAMAPFRACHLTQKARPVFLAPGPFAFAGSPRCALRAERLVAAPRDVELSTPPAAETDGITASVNSAALEGAEMPAAETLAAVWSFAGVHTATSMLSQEFPGGVTLLGAVPVRRRREAGPTVTGLQGKCCPGTRTQITREICVRSEICL